MKLKVRVKIKPPKRKGRYIFTDNKHPKKGIFATVLGIIAAVTVYVAVRKTFEAGGQAPANYAAAVILALVYSICGLVLGIISRMEKDIFKLFPNLGIVLNLLAIICIAGILYLGLV
ncbi:MAG: hypothetical protein KA965_05605 [Butyrivibrio sp.]|nr:hypothetical protein [Butyrivibrio sp.]